LNTKHPISLILVPQGAEHKAVRQGLSRLRPHLGADPLVLPIPIGLKPLGEYLKQLELKDLSNCSGILLTGLCGSLKHDYGVGDIANYQSCLYRSDHSSSSLNCNPELIGNCLPTGAHLVNGLTSDRIIHLAAEKIELGKAFPADVVDMEGFAVLEFFSKLSIPVAMLRIVSDDVRFDLPSLDNAIASDGTLKPIPLALGMLRQPVAALRLIRGSLKALQVLQHTIAIAFATK
jgi:hypothetical protein